MPKKCNERTKERSRKYLLIYEHETKDYWSKKTLNKTKTLNHDCHDSWGNYRIENEWFKDVFSIMSQ